MSIEYAETGAPKPRANSSPAVAPTDLPGLVGGGRPPDRAELPTAPVGRRAPRRKPVDCGDLFRSWAFPRS